MFGASAELSDVLPKRLNYIVHEIVRVNVIVREGRPPPLKFIIMFSYNNVLLVSSAISQKKKIPVQF